MPTADSCIADFLGPRALANGCRCPCPRCRPAASPPRPAEDPGRDGKAAASGDDSFAEKLKKLKEEQRKCPRNL